MGLSHTASVAAAIIIQVSWILLGFVDMCVNYLPSPEAAANTKVICYACLKLGNSGI